MQNRFIVVLMVLISSGLTFNTVAHASPPPALSPFEQMQECKDYGRTQPVEVRQCISACRGARAKSASSEKINQCQIAYNTFRKAIGQSTGKAAPQGKSYHLDSLTATFSVRNGRVNRFNLISKQSQIAQRAAKICAFKLPKSQLENTPFHFHVQFNDKIRDIKKQGKNYAYKLSGISWTEDGTQLHYPCSVEHVDVVALER